MAVGRQWEIQLIVSHQQPCASSLGAIVCEGLLGDGCFMEVAFTFRNLGIAVGINMQEIK